MRRLFLQPLPYLLFLLAVSYWGADRVGWLEPEVTNDTQGYVWLFQAETLEQKLSGLRTYGYPLILELAGLTDPGWGAVPEFHFLAFAAAVLLFWVAMKRFSRSPWLAFAAAMPLVFSAAVAHIRLVVTDSIGESLGLASVSLLLLYASAGRRARLWLGPLLALAVFAAYFTRPNYQFLVVLVPMLGAVLMLCRDRREPVRWLRSTVVLFLLAFLPWLAVSAVRAAATGHFGIASQGGYSLGSLGCLFLDEELIAELPDHQQELATEIFNGRTARNWKPMTLYSWPPQYQRQYGLTMFRVAEPAATRIVLAEEGRHWNEDLSTDLGPLDVPGMIGPSALAIDSRLGDLGTTLIRKRPLLYLKWISDGAATGLSKLYQDPWVRRLLPVLVLSIPVLLLRARSEPAVVGGDWTRGSLAVLGLGLVAGVYFVGHTAIIILIHWPKDRYAVAANLLIPSFLAVAVFEIWRRILTADSR